VTTSPLKWRGHLPKVTVGRWPLSCRHLVIGLGFSQPTTCVITRGRTKHIMCWANEWGRWPRKRRLILQSEEGWLSNRGSALSAHCSSRDRGQKSWAKKAGPIFQGQKNRSEKVGRVCWAIKNLWVFCCCKLIPLKTINPLLCWFFPHKGFQGISSVFLYYVIGFYLFMLFILVK
jgi:hypothetical protein